MASISETSTLRPKAYEAAMLDAIATRYDEVPHWPASKVVGHAGRLVIGTVAGKRIAALAGRVHFYEGYDLATVAFATRVMGRLGVKTLILTNAAGGINVTLTPGMLMIMDDHINLLGSNPLVGPNEDQFGPRFPDMSEVYSKRLRGLADRVAQQQGLQIGHATSILGSGGMRSKVVAAEMATAAGIPVGGST